jgi:hypothetical protein
MRICHFKRDIAEARIDEAIPFFALVCIIFPVPCTGALPDYMYPHYSIFAIPAGYPD